MKANQTLRQNEEGVSPVIGVILMVAITVVLAAVVFVLVTKLSGNNNATTPTIGANADDAARTVTIANAPNNLKWSDFKVAGCTAVVKNSGGSPLTITDSSTAGPLIAAGDVISGCTTGQTITITYTPSNGIAWGPHTFP